MKKITNTLTVFKFSVFFVIAGFIPPSLFISFSHGGVKNGVSTDGLLCQEAVTAGAGKKNKAKGVSEQPYLMKTLESLYGGKWRLDPEEEKKLIIEYQKTGSEAAFNRLLYSHIRIMWRVILQVTFEWGASAMALHVREEILSGIVRAYHKALAVYDTEPPARLASFALYKIEERARGLMIRCLMSLRTFHQPHYAPEHIVGDSGYVSGAQEETVYFEQIIGAVARSVEAAGFNEKEKYVLRNYVFTDYPVSSEAVGKKFNVSASAVRKLARRLLQRIAEDEAVIPEVRGLVQIRLSSTKKPPRRKESPARNPIEDIADFEKVMELALKSMENLNLTPWERAVLERYIFSKSPESLRAVGEDFGLSYNEALYQKSKAVQKILQNEAVPPEVKNFIRWRVKNSSIGGGKLVILSPEAIESGLKAMESMDLTLWETAVLKRHVLTNHSETLKAIGVDIGIRKRNIGELNIELMNKIFKNDNFPDWLKSVIEKKLISGKRNRPPPTAEAERAICGGI